jgi:hypothetical protein
MTAQASQIFRAFTLGESIAPIADKCGISCAQAWTQLRRAIAEIELKNPSTIDSIRWQQYVLLMRIADRAFAAFEKSAQDGLSETAVQTIHTRNESGQLGLRGKSVIRHVRKDAGDVRYLEVAMKALAEIRDLFKIGAEAESKLGLAARNGSALLDALARGGSIGIQMQSREPLKIR